MTNQLKQFKMNSNSPKLNVWDRGGQPWFLAGEVLKTLGFSTAGKKTVLASLGEDEKAKERIKHLRVSKRLLREEFRMSAHIAQWFISESGMYKLIMRSNKPEVKPFQDWVTKTVIPAIRKDGGYIMGEEKVASGEMSEDELVLKALKVMEKKISRLATERGVALLDR